MTVAGKVHCSPMDAIGTGSFRWKKTMGVPISLIGRQETIIVLSQWPLSGSIASSGRRVWFAIVSESLTLPTVDTFLPLHESTLRPGNVAHWTSEGRNATESECSVRVAFPDIRNEGRAKHTAKIVTIFESAARFAASFDPAIRSAGSSLDRVHRLGRHGVWHAHHAAEKGLSDLPANEEPAGRSTAARAYKAGDYWPIPRRRG